MPRYRRNLLSSRASLAEPGDRGAAKVMKVQARQTRTFPSLTLRGLKSVLGPRMPPCVREDQRRAARCGIEHLLQVTMHRDLNLATDALAGTLRYGSQDKASVVGRPRE